MLPARASLLSASMMARDAARDSKKPWAKMRVAKHEVPTSKCNEKDLLDAVVNSVSFYAEAAEHPVHEGRVAGKSVVNINDLIMT